MAKINIEQLKTSVTTLKNYVDYNMDPSRVYLDKEEINLTFSIDNNFNVVDTSVFDEKVENYGNQQNVTACYKNFTTNEVDYTNTLSKFTGSFINTNKEVYGEDDIRKNRPTYSCTKSKNIKLGQNNTKYLLFQMIVKYGKRGSIDSNNRLTYEDSNNNICVLLYMDKGKYTDEEIANSGVDLSNTVTFNFVFSKFNDKILLQFPLLKAGNTGRSITLLDNEKNTGEYSINLSDGDSNDKSIVLGTGNSIKNGSTSSVLGSNNVLGEETNYSLVIGTSNTMSVPIGSTDSEGILCMGSYNNLKVSRSSGNYGTILLGKYLNASTSGYFFGNYGTFDKDTVMGIANGTSPTNENILFQIKKDGRVKGADPTDDNDLSTKKYVDDTTSSLTSQLQELASKLEDYTNPFNITSLTVSPSVAQKGSSTNVTVKWSYNKDITSQTLNNETLDKSLREKTYISVNKDTNYVLNCVTTSNSTKNRTATIRFYNGIFYGKSSSNTYDSALINSLTKTLSDSKARTVTINAGEGEYLLYCLPSRLGVPVFNIGGFDGGFAKVATIAYTNSNSYTENYDIYRSDNPNLGVTTITIK